MRISVGSDHKGFKLKEYLKKHLKKQGYTIIDVGTYSNTRTDYSYYAAEAARQVSIDNADRAIVICYTGIGVSIAANKIRKIRASLCTNVKSAKLTREHNDSNVLALGCNDLSNKEAEEIVDTWLTTDFSDEKRHKNRINQIRLLENKETEGDGIL